MRYTKLLSAAACLAVASGAAAQFGFGLPVDLDGTYKSGSSHVTPGIASATTHPFGDGGAGQVYELSGGVNAVEGTFTPFSDLIKPPTPLQINMRGQSLHATVQLQSPSFANDDRFQIGLGRGVRTGDGNAEVWLEFRRTASGVNVALKSDYAGDAHMLAFNGENEFEVVLHVSSDGATATAEVVPYWEGETYYLGPLSLSPSAEDNTLNTSFFAGWAGNETKSRSLAALSNVHTSAGGNWLWISGLPYVQPGESALYTIGMANMGFEAFGYLAVTASDGLQNLVDINYHDFVFDQHSGPEALDNINGAVAQGNPGSMANQFLALVTFTASTEEGVTGMSFAGSGSKFVDGADNPVAANTMPSNRIVIDGTDPTVQNFRVYQDGVDITSTGGQAGPIEIRVTVADLGAAYSGLELYPTLTLLKPESVPLTAYSGAGNEVRADYNLGPGESISGWQLRVIAADSAGNVTNETLGFGANAPPTIGNLDGVFIQAANGAGRQVSLSVNVEDLDGDELSVEWKVGGTVVHTEIVPAGPAPTNATVTLTHTFPIGTSEVEVSVSDGTQSVSENAEVFVFVDVAGFENPLAALVLEGENPPLPEKAFNKNRTLPMKLQVLATGGQLGPNDIVAPRIVSIERVGAGPPQEVLELVGGEETTGVDFVWGGDGWQYNLRCRDLGPGEYRITLLLADGRNWLGRFVLK